jgi:putative DNA primase/helicase
VGAAIAIGQLMPVMSASKEEELDKKLDAALLAGQSLIAIDNFNGELRGDKLCQVIERPMVQVRIFGKLEMSLVENRSCCFANGNNLVITDEIIRRTISARLDAKIERPEYREFAGNPVDCARRPRQIHRRRLDHLPSLSHSR